MRVGVNLIYIRHQCCPPAKAVCPLSKVGLTVGKTETNDDEPDHRPKNFKIPQNQSGYCQASSGQVSSTLLQPRQGLMTAIPRRNRGKES